MPHRATRRTLHSIAAQAAGGAALSASAIAALVSWWALDEESGNRADSHGGFTATDQNTVGYDTGVQGNAAYLQYANVEYFQVTSDAALAINTVDFSVCGWFKLTSTNQTNVPMFHKLYNWRVQLTNGATFTPMVQVGKASAWLSDAAVFGGSALSANIWYFLCAWHDVSERTLYISVNDGTTYSATYGENAVASAERLDIGSQTGGLRPNGYLDELCVFRGYMLTEAERTALYNSGNGVTYAQAVGA